MQLDVEKFACGDACEFAKQRYYGIARWRSLWTILAFDEEWVKAVVSGLASVVNSVAVRFVLARRKEAKAEEEAAYADVQAKCGTTEADNVRQQLTFLGFR